MFASKRYIKIAVLMAAITSTFPSFSYANKKPVGGITKETLAQQLGWVSDPLQDCGGYYLEQSFSYPVQPDTQQNNLVEITGNEGLITKGNSVLEGKVTITRSGQQITANKAYLYRDPASLRFKTVEMIGNVHLREPNTLIVAKQAHYDFQTQSKSLINTLYRTAISGRQIIGPNVSSDEIQHERKIVSMTAWGKAYQLSQSKPKIFELDKASYSTCPPINPAWRVKASHIILDKNSGRGYATNARILIRNIPVFYTPYINFPIDSRRKSGFLWPTYGGSSKSGPSLYVPYYWNMAENYDMVITPALLTKRGAQFSNRFRYLTQTNSGEINFSILPDDRLFREFQKSSQEKFSNLADPEGAELRRLQSDSNTRKALSWRDDANFNLHWSSHVDFNYAGDEYYLRDFGTNLNEVTQNQLLQEGDVYYKGENWNFTGRMQAYQTLHPFNEPAVLNNYRRFPQFILNGDYPDQAFGLDYFINNEITHFDILNNPGDTTSLPIGHRLHTQPGISWPLSTPYFFINPRFQLALTQYDLQQTQDIQIPNNSHRSIPIFDIAAGLAFNRDTTLFHHLYQQTLEPQIYYTYIPYHNQNNLPLFDTNLSTLTYDQIFSYNRFNGLDRIGDANQIGVGVTTRFIDQKSGLEKIRLGIGEILYFTNRNVVLCSGINCQNLQKDHSNYQRLSPISGTAIYTINPNWNLNSNAIWNPVTKQLDNSTIALHYQPDEKRIINFGYSYARGGDIYSGIQESDPSNNLKTTDLSAAWPIKDNISAVGRWSQNWNHVHLQNLLYGLQYDTCCWAVRFIGGRNFTGVDPNNNNKPQYNTEFYIQFSLKGLGNIATGNPNGSLGAISGYNTQFGQDI
jgi:LPS-assembly protein